MKKIRFIKKYLKYYFSSKSKYAIHSPFVFSLLTGVIQNRKKYSEYKIIENIRKKLFHNNNFINVTDLGAGSNSKAKDKRKIKDIAKKYSQASKYGKLLFRLAKHFQPETIIELGTSLGISTMYQSVAVPQSKIITIEGCEKTAQIAQENFNQLKLKNIELITGNFDNVLPGILKNINKLDYVFFDGNHTKEATIEYFNQCLKKSHSKTLFVFDDIHWSEGMEEAWNFIKKHEKVIITIDLFFMGLVFFNENISKQDFVISY